jgi:hypothetical protein
MAYKFPQILLSGQKVHGYNSEGVPICSAKCRNGTVCQQTLISKNGRCRMHGGTSPGAPIVHGGRSKLLKSLNLFERVQDSLSDPELLSHKNNIALVEGLMKQVGDDFTATPGEWQEVKRLGREATDQVLKVFKFIDQEVDKVPEEIKDQMSEILSTLETLGRVIDHGLSHASRISRLEELSELQLKHRRAEDRRLASLEANLNVADANRIGMALVAAIMARNIPSDIKKEIAHDVIRILGQPALPGAH